MSNCLKTTPLVSVAVITYNSEATIRQCIDSILMQKTDFDFEIVVSDDSSKDGTPTILSDYSNQFPGRFVLLLNSENIGVSRNNNQVLLRCKGEFVAMCEGDDFWLDEEKLSKQVSFLRNNMEYGFVGSPCVELFPNGEMKPETRSDEMGHWVLTGDVFKASMSAPVTRTPSLCFRRSIITPYLSYIGAGNDTVLQAILAKHSLYAYWTSPMAVYRRGGISSTHTCLEKELKYNDYVYTNRHLKNQLFPEHFQIDENVLLDREDYIILRYAIKELKWRKALRQKKKLRTDRYKNKAFSKYLLGPITCCFLSLIIRMRNG